MTIRRRKGVAIVETKKGILLVSGNGEKYLLPGGGAEKNESRKKATIRELYEETGLKAEKIKYLFSTIGHKWYNNKGKAIRNYTKVFLVKAIGKPRPKNEINYIAYWRPNTKINLLGNTKETIEKYLIEYKKIPKL